MAEQIVDAKKPRMDDKITQVRHDPMADPYTWVRPSGRIIPANAKKPKN